MAQLALAVTQPVFSARALLVGVCWAWIAIQAR
jgi:hypothetical protein